MKKTIYRTVLMVEVLSPEPIPATMSLQDIAADGDYGEYSLLYTRKVDNKPVSGKTAAKLVQKQGSDTEFFNMDLFGNKIIEEDENLALD
jgi:hypothetical protein